MSDKCESCIHDCVCIEITDECYYEPKRVKCEDCFVATHMDSSLIHQSKFNKNDPCIQDVFDYCPKCGTKIEVKE